MGENEENAPQLPKPDPALRRLDRLVGTWAINGRTLDADEDNISGRTAFEYLRRDRDTSELKEERPS